MPLLYKGTHRTKIAILPRNSIRAITQNFNSPAMLQYHDEWVVTSCIKCKDQYCMRYNEYEIECESFPDFAYERNFDVCPVSAIKWDYTEELPRIDNTACIGCGLCATRCPVGAIYKSEGNMKISSTSSPVSIEAYSEESILAQAELVRQLKNIAWDRRFQCENDTIMEQLYYHAGQFSGRSLAPNLMVRNILIALGFHCSVSRSGDVYTRIDAVYETSHSWDKIKGAVEIEFGRDTLEASRGILDDIAVLHSRNGICKNDNVALVVCLSFPNKRQGYFQVIKDVKKVLDLNIQTISLGALLILMWNGAFVNMASNEFYVDFDNMSIRNAMEYRLGRQINITEGKLGILEPEK